MKPCMNIDTENNEFTAVIPCDCHYCGGLVVDGIDIDYIGPRHEDNLKAAFLHISMWKRLAWEVLPTLWQRIKLGFKVMFGAQSLFIDDMVFFKPQVAMLRNVLDTALRNWPSDAEVNKKGPSLEEIYAQMQREQEIDNE